MSVRIPLSYNPIDAVAMNEVLQRYQQAHHNTLITDFELAVQSATGSPYAVALNSGTAAIHLGLKALGVGEGDEVAVSTFTYVASVNPIIYLGARPILIDSEKETWNMDPGLLEKAIKACVRKGKKPKAIIVVYAYGMPARIDEIMELSRIYEIPVLEDAAEALGSTYKGKHVGTFGTIGIVSFNNNKIVTTYGGGALLTGDERIHKKVLHWASQSREDKPFYEHEEIGYSYRMGPVNAAMGMVEIGKLIEYVNKRRTWYKRYAHDLLQRGFIAHGEAPISHSNRWLSTFLHHECGVIERISKLLAGEGIESRPLWKPMHLQPAFKAASQVINGTAESLFESGICLPSGNSMHEKQFIEIIEHISRRETG